MRKITIFLCALVMVCATIFTASAASNVSASISRSSSSINAGDKVTITLSAKATGCSSGGVEVSFPTSTFELVSGSCVVSGAFMKDFDTKTKDGVFAFDSASKINGKVLTFTLKAKSGAATGSYKVTVKFKADSTVVTKTTTITIACEHTYSDNCDATCNKCGASRKVNHKWGSPTILKEADCKNTGSAKYTCTNCKETKTDTIAKAAHTYDHGCDVDCNVCGATRTVTHNYAWSCNETEHWQECTNCHIQGEKGGHTLAEELSANEIEHGYLCTVCQLMPKSEGHAYESPCDDNCETCGYIRTVNHPYTVQFNTDAETHWRTCTLCGEIAEKGNHIPSAAATETTDQVCITCGYLLAVAGNHTHEREGDWIIDKESHSFSCRCGVTVELVAHSWDNGTIDEQNGVVVYSCTDCGTQMATAYKPEFVFSVENVVKEITESPLMMIFALSLCGTVAIILILLIVIIVLGAKNRKLKRRITAE